MLSGKKKRLSFSFFFFLVSLFPEPLVFLVEALFLFGCEMRLNVEELEDLLLVLPSKHVGDGCAAEVAKGLDVHEICRLERVEKLLVL